MRACDYYKEFESPKILLPDISLRGNFIFDSIGHYATNTAYIIASSDFYLLGILNSSLITYFYKQLSAVFSGGYLRFIFQYLVQLPIKKPSKEDKKAHDAIVSLVTSMLDLNKRLPLAKTDQEKTIIARQIDSTDRRIDELVYELYGLTNEEIAIVEGSVKT